MQKLALHGVWYLLQLPEENVLTDQKHGIEDFDLLKALGNAPVALFIEFAATQISFWKETLFLGQETP